MERHFLDGDGMNRRFGFGQCLEYAQRGVADVIGQCRSLQPAADLVPLGVRMSGVRIGHHETAAAQGAVAVRRR